MNRNEGSGRRQKLIRALVSVAIVGICAGSWYLYNQKPAEGVIQNDVLKSRTSDDTKAKNGHFKGSTMTFDYPTVYADTQSNPPTAKIAEQYSLGARIDGAESRKISITITKIGIDTTLKEDSAYKFRQNDAKNYVFENIMVNSNSVDKFTKNNGGEVTYFIPGTKYYAIVSATSTRANGEFATDVASLIDSFRWLEWDKLKQYENTPPKPADSYDPERLFCGRTN